jgi:hypothetical protein
MGRLPRAIATSDKRNHQAVLGYICPGRVVTITFGDSYATLALALPNQKVARFHDTDHIIAKVRVIAQIAREMEAN